MVISPTVGRVVWFFDADYTRDEQPEAAIVTYVWNDRMVNLVVFDPNGEPRPETSVSLHQEGDQFTPPRHAGWMPYQVGQAKKHAGEAPAK